MLLVEDSIPHGQRVVLLERLVAKRHKHHQLSAVADERIGSGELVVERRKCPTTLRVVS